MHDSSLDHLKTWAYKSHATVSYRAGTDLIRMTQTLTYEALVPEQTNGCNTSQSDCDIGVIRLRRELHFGAPPS